MQIDGWTYTVEYDDDDDVRKLDHYVTKGDKEVRLTSGSSYRPMTADQIRAELKNRNLIEMNENVKNLIGHLANGNNRKAEEVFKNVMDQKIGAAIRAKQPEVAQAMFNKKS